MIVRYFVFSFILLLFYLIKFILLVLLLDLDEVKVVSIYLHNLVLMSLDALKLMNSKLLVFSDLFHRQV